MKRGNSFPAYNNFLLKTNSSHSMSIHTCSQNNKRPTVNTNLDRNSASGPFTPVYNAGGLFKRNSLISNSNTVMNES